MYTNIPTGASTNPKQKFEHEVDSDWNWNLDWSLKQVLFFFFKFSSDSKKKLLWDQLTQNNDFYFWRYNLAYWTLSQTTGRIVVKPNLNEYSIVHPDMNSDPKNSTWNLSKVCSWPYWHWEGMILPPPNRSNRLFNMKQIIRGNCDYTLNSNVVILGERQKLVNGCLKGVVILISMN